MPKRTKQSISSKKLPLYVILLVVLVIVVISLILNKKPTDNVSSQTPTPPTPTTPAAKTFRASSIMGGFTIEIPAGFEVEENFGALSIKKSLQVIYIGKSATNFDTLQGYLNDLDEKNNTVILKENKSKINSFDAVKRTIKFGSPDEIQTSYIIYVDGLIYDFFITDLSLEKELDQIAQSFRVPE